MSIELISQIFELVIIPLLGVLTTYAVKLVNSKIAEIKTNTKNELETKYLIMLDQTISDCVIATTQTYVDSLKNKGEFTKEAQQEAFNKTYKAIITILNEDAMEYLNEVVGDLNAYITNKIESEVKLNK